MKKNSILVALALLGTINVWADDVTKDTLKVVDVEEVVIIATPKENLKLREQPASSTILSQQDMRDDQIYSIKDLTSVVPNLFIPDYGSKLTSAIYIRGAGSRINTPSVGLYVDNVPYMDKSAFDFNYADIERIDVLRGPQGTLYGRSAMGGLIRVYTKSPFDYQGTDLRLSAGTYNQYTGSVTHYHRVSNKFAFSTGAFYDYAGGFFKNTYLDKKIDRTNAAGGRFRGIYLPTANLKLDLNVSYEYSDQGGYPYGLYDKETGKTADPAYNEQSSYYRNLLNAGLNLEYQAKKFTLSSVTGFQHLKDRMFMDQDFSIADMFNLIQKQKQSTISQEFTFKSKGNKRWQWVTGVSGFYQWLDMNAPVTFKQDGLSMIQEYMDEAMASTPVRVKILNETMPISGRFNMPTMGAALFHESTFNNVIWEGLSATIGLRADYENMKIAYNSGCVLSTQTYMNGAAMGGATDNEYIIVGKEKNDYWILLPKFALKYAFNNRNNIYASVTRGHRSGGYNVQMFSDLIEGQMTTQSSTNNVKDVISYKPEYAWNYELGSHFTLWEGKLWADMATFVMDTRDQQIAQFSPSQMGRMMVNAGHSRSYGAELALRAKLTNALSMNTSYGYTNATFINFDDGQANYKDKHVPFIPQQTLTVGAEYAVKCDEHSMFDEVRFLVNYSGAGKIYWTESNDVAQNFYGTVNWKICTSIGNAQIDLWSRNFLNKKYNTFYFESSGQGYAQQARPMQFGVDLRCRF
ncbi:TonB-dependent receptor [uncultured Bacteroides sp.]|uniref:TonB-dependent receptor n=1 Tax=uncultured Bacteroides sp. TaxID=162156 RepID=UPI002AA906E9|nr:TonB-dependent receptor [uncultured Bacteroides sp.]